ncbi:MAG TPA: SpoIVB peptidase [Oscillospiraceae bacterium]|jgi:stage IV sporulation protein B|nr:SpoIVB peptidase [Oscillospiraceae bacterium]
MEIMKKAIRIIDGIFALCLIIIYSFIVFGNIVLPDKIEAYSTKKIEYKSVYSVENNSSYLVDYQNNSKVSPIENDIKLLGIIPVKTTSIIQSKPKKVSVSGESFGIKLYTDGVIIVGIRDVETDKGKCNPAKEAGLEKGDIIIEINGKKVYSADSVTDILNDNNGKDYKITVKRNGNYKEFLLKPAYSSSQGCYKVGLWVRDSTAGVGTITYYDKSNNTVSALGHPITDVDTNEIMPILDGEAVRATVTKIYKSKAGEAGSLCCEFTNDIIGTLKKNCQSGIYGKYTCTLKNTYEYEVASPNEIVRGPVQILCTIDSGKAKFYNAQISRISYRENKKGKNMVVKITDERLLEKTGGIVQGMSGSPIIQNGKLVGALTHVIVDSPEKGYAIFAQDMVDEL